MADLEPRPVAAAHDPKVSVIVPTYNRAHFLGEAVRSVLAQTFSDLELVVVDDGSTDGTPDVLRAVSDGRLRCLRQENRGVSAALNAGIRAARGASIARLDSDDVWLPELLEIETAALDARPEVGVVYARAQAMDRDGAPLPCFWGSAERFPGEPLQSLLHGDFTCTVTSLARRACFERVGLYDESLRVGEDWHMWLRVARHFQFGFVDRVLARVRRHEGNVTGLRSPFYEDFIEGRTKVLDRVFRDGDLPAPILRLKSIAYRNASIDAGLHLLGRGEYRRALRAFRRAVAAGANPFAAAARIIASTLAWYVIGRQALKRHLARLCGRTGAEAG